MSDLTEEQILELAKKAGLYPFGVFSNGERFVNVTGHAILKFVELMHATHGVTPITHVGESHFEGWFANYNPAGKGDKQRARDAYAAGLGEQAEHLAGVPASKVGPTSWPKDWDGRDREAFHSALTGQPRPAFDAAYIHHDNCPDSSCQHLHADRDGVRGEAMQAEAAGDPEPHGVRGGDGGQSNG